MIFFLVYNLDNIGIDAKKRGIKAMKSNNILIILVLVTIIGAFMVGCQSADSFEKSLNEGIQEAQNDEKPFEDSATQVKDAASSEEIPATSSKHDPSTELSVIEESELIAFWTLGIESEEYRGLNLMGFGHMMSYAIDDIFYSGTWSFDSNNKHIILNVERAKNEGNIIEDYPESLTFEIVSFSNGILTVDQNGKILKFQKNI